MAPEYGATIGFFPIDAETLRYLRLTGRDPDLIELVEAYAKEQGMFRTDASPDPMFHGHTGADLGSVVPSLAGPRTPAGPRATHGKQESVQRGNAFADEERRRCQDRGGAE